MYREDDLIVINIQYNPKEKQKLLYSIIGELNEVIAHEIRHFDQYRTKKFDFSNGEEEDPVKYYTDPKELDAQVYGFNRLSKLSKKPFEEVVRNWFDTHKEFHNLKDDEVRYVISKILDYKSTY
jgi:cupin superfamily acireductone dioxygenase involved in methionine salvage